MAGGFLQLQSNQMAAARLQKLKERKLQIPASLRSFQPLQP
jgi:hypothetical protein